jgi:hypothetical protein
MKKYYYHVVYYRIDKNGDNLGDVTACTSRPIKTEEDINSVREGIRADSGGIGIVVILGWQLLRIEDVEPEEVATK